MWRRSTRSEFLDGNSIPNLNSRTNLTKDYSNIRNFKDKDIYNYLLIKMNIKRQLKSINFLEDRNVHSVKYRPITDECSHCAIRYKVIQLFSLSDPKKRTDFDVKTFSSNVTGNVFTAYCTCTAKYFVFSGHIGPYFVVYFTNNLIRTILKPLKNPFTDSVTTWNCRCPPFLFVWPIKILSDNLIFSMF